MTIEQLNQLDGPALHQALLGCCGAKQWVKSMADLQPFADAAALHTAADLVFDRLQGSDWLEAFAAHPKLGDLDSLRMRYAGNKQWSSGEQAGVDSADEAILTALAKGNAAYEQRFGYIFILCATGKSAQQMLDALNGRLHSEPADELPVAAEQQRMITHLRIDKLLGPD